MTIELAPAPAPAQTTEVEQQQQQQLQKGVPAEQQQQQQAGFAMPDMELHRACAEGKLDDVRAVLSRTLEQLETLDMSTGCTPIVLAIRANHVDIVRELLSAGAIVPPPGLTNDPVMLSLLYPQPVYGLPPQFMGHQQHHMPPAEFYPPQFYAQQQQQQANLPPADVSKTIPCRNFPNCKYGSACAFFHPRQPQPGFYGYDQQQPPFFPNGFQPQQQQQQHDTQHQQQSASDGPVSTASADHTNDSNAPQFSSNDQTQQPQQPSLSTAPPPFIPYGMASPPPPAQFGISPMSPPMMPMPMSPHDQAFFASSPPPNGMVMPPMNGFVPRRQSINQGPNGYPAGGKSFHGKKPSFSGGSRPFANGNGTSTGNGNGERRPSSWKDGNPPPCAFFAQGKCRNGEFCKFPHLDAEGTDCRHPDVIRGIIAPAPPLQRVPRQMRMGNFGQYDPTRQFVPRSQQQQQAAMNGVAVDETVPAPAPAPIETVPESVALPAAPAVEAAAPETTATTQAPAPAKQPAAPVANGNGNIARSASQPGVQRFQPNGHAHGFHSRSHSPAPSNVSFHGNGHPRRGGRPFNAGVHANGGQAGRSVSAGENKQRVPSADEFPALGGNGAASGNTSPQERSSAQFSKTAAQVLSAPAPPKPEPPVQAPAQAQQAEEDGVTMDDESESDAVIVNVNKPSSTPAAAQETATPSTPTEAEESKSVSPEPASAPAPAAAAAKRGPISFASVASSVASAAGLTESTPVALKA